MQRYIDRLADSPNHLCWKTNRFPGQRINTAGSRHEPEGLQTGSPLTAPETPMTAQAAEILHYKGQEFELTGEPLELYSDRGQNPRH